MKRSTLSRAAALPAAFVLTAGLAACGGQSTGSTGSAEGGDLTGSVAIDGSSTVAPLSESAADLYREQAPGVNVTVATSGTGGGFQKFCAGETDVSDASRPIKDEEAADCEANGIEFTELVMANDGLSVVVNPDNDWADCLTVEQLQTMWSPESEGTVTNWNQIDPSFPDQELTLFGAGTDSGTFDYFTEAINGESGATRTDYSPSEDDNVTVQGVQGDVGAVGYFGLSYVEENEGAVKAVAVDGGEGCVEPSSETVRDGSYSPLGRPLFIYVSNNAFAEKPQVADFVTFYVENDDAIAENALFVPLSEDQKAAAQEALSSLGG